MRTYAARRPVLARATGRAGRVPFLLFYNGATNGSTYQIGAAYSADEFHWSKLPQLSPGLAPGSGWESQLVKDPWPLKLGVGDYRMWYAGYDGSHFGIGYATSSLGIGSWSKSGSNPVLTRGGSGAWDEGGVEFPVVLYDPSDGSRPFKMWYVGWSVAAPTVQQIGYAYSADGIVWTKSSANPVLTVGAGGSYDAASVYSGGIVRVGTTYNLFYGGAPTIGSGANGTNVCLATFIDPEGVYTKSAGNPLLAPSTALQSLTGDLASGATVVTIASTSAFHQNEPILLFDAGQNRDDGVIKSIDSSTQITLLRPAARSWTVANSATIRSAYSGSLFPRQPFRLGTNWILFGTAYQQYGGGVLAERAVAFGSSSLDSGWSFDYGRGLLLPLGGTWDTASAENPGVIDNR